MDPRQYQQQNSGPPHTQSQAQQNRFSWQLPADGGARGAAQQQQAHAAQAPPAAAAANEFGQPPRQQSWTETPADMQPSHQNWPRTAQHLPSEPPIPQSPTATVAPAAPQWEAAQGRSTHTQQTTQANPYPYGQPQLVVPYAVLQQAGNAPADTKGGSSSRPLSIQTNNSHANAHNTFSPGAMAPELASSSVDSDQLQSPSTVTSTSPRMTYTPHATTSRNTFSSADIKGGQPFAPDDLIQTHQAAAIEEGRAPVVPTTATATAQAHQPGQIRHPNMKTEDEEGKKGEWKHGLMSCASEADTCCLGFGCPCILHSRTSYRNSARSEKRDPTDLLGFKSCNGTCTVMAISLCLGFIFPAIARTRIRHHYNIEGGAGTDFCTACLCCCCVVVQNEREVKEREESRRRWAGPATGAGMQYAPPPTEMRYAPGGGAS